MAAAADAHPLDNAGWHALTGPHAGFAIGEDCARRYGPDVSVFSAVDAVTPAAWDDLARLPGNESFIVLFRDSVSEPPKDWTTQARGWAHQMSVSSGFSVGAGTGTGTGQIERLTTDHVGDMLALIALTEPGPFLPRTIELGDYFGVFDDGRLVAMAGERLRLEGHTEVSAVCTHPDVRGRGLAAALTHRVAAQILERGEQPFLHVAETNDNARRVYERLGFATRRLIEFAVLRPPRRRPALTD